MSIYREVETATLERIRQLKEADGRIIPDCWYWGEVFDQGYNAHEEDLGNRRGP